MAVVDRAVRHLEALEGGFVDHGKSLLQSLLNAFAGNFDLILSLLQVSFFISASVESLLFLPLHFLQFLLLSASFVEVRLRLGFLEYVQEGARSLEYFLHNARHDWLADGFGFRARQLLLVFGGHLR